MPTCLVYRLGLVPYTQAWELQNRLAQRIAAGLQPPSLLLLEHPHVFTFGRQGQAANLLWDEDTLALRGVEVQWVDRGGDVTYHGPGQVVGYPLLPLAPGGFQAGEAAQGRQPPADLVGYLRKLEDALILALLRFGVAGAQAAGRTGVWVQADARSRCRACPPDQRQPLAKIASIGVKVDARGVTRHGFALNVAPDMGYWDGIIACGLPDASPVALADLLDPPPAMSAVLDAVTAAFGQVFAYDMQSASLSSDLFPSSPQV